MSNSPSHRRGTLKGVPTVKSPTSHFLIPFNSIKSNLSLEPLLAYPFCGTLKYNLVCPTCRVARVTAARRHAPSQQVNNRKGTNGISTNGVIVVVCQRDFLGTFVNHFYIQRSARVYLFPQSDKMYYYCSGPISVDPICPEPRTAQRVAGASACDVMHGRMVRGNWSTGFLDYILPKTPGGFRRCSETSVRTKQVSCWYSWKTVFSRLLPVDFRRKPEPVLKYSLRWCHDVPERVSDRSLNRFH